MKINIESTANFSIQNISFDKDVLSVSISVEGANADQKYKYSIDFGEGSGVAKSSIRIVDYLKQYVNVSRLKPQTEETYRHVEYYLNKYGNNWIEDITTEYLQGFIAFLEQQGLSKGTVYLYFSKLSCILHHAYKYGLFDERILLRVNRPRRDQKKRVFLTESEIQRLMKVKLPENKMNIRDMFLFSCFSGLRFSDVCGLKHSNIENKNGRMTISFYQQKTSTEETLPLSEQARYYILKQQHSGQYVFKQESKAQVNTFLKQWCKMAKVKKNISFHTARHTFCVMLLAHDVPIYTVQQLMCHTDIKTTNIYADILNSTKRKAVKKLPIFKECVYQRTM